MLAALWTRLQGWMGAALLGAGALLALIVTARRSGRREAERETLAARVEAAKDRAHADADALRDPDPVERLRRDWQRGV